MTLNADKVNGDGYLTPTATSDANDFTRFVGDPQISVSATFSAGTPVQLDALIAVGKLTFTDEGAVPKFLAGLGGMLRAGASAAKMAPSVMR